MLYLAVSMVCPRCKKELKKEEFHGVSIDRCASCNGVWFDRGELKKAKDNTDENLRWLNVDLFEEKEGKYRRTEGDKKCPVDVDMMEAHEYVGSNVSVDICPTCKGVWLDAREFEKIINFLHKKIYSESAKEYSVDAVKQLLEIGTGGEDIASEVKDFFIVTKLLESRFVVEHPFIIELNKFLYTYLPLK